jgi:hypothetical protein
MGNQFNIIYNNQLIRVEGGEGYVLKYPDAKYLMIVWSTTGWFIEDKSNGDWITEQQVQEIGKMIEENEE